MQASVGTPDRRATGGLVSVVGLLVLSGAGLGLAWTTTGSDPAVVGWWLAVVGLGVLLPGWALTRCLHASSSSPTDVGWAGPVGILVALLTWLVARLLGVALPSLVVGPALALLLVALPATRRRLVGSSAATVRWPVGAWAALTVTTLLTVRWLWVGGLADTAPVPTARFWHYYQDLLYQTALTGEARRNLVPGYPMVDGEPLGYHWFFHALAAQLGGAGLHDLDVVTRLLPATLVVMVTLLAAALGSQVTGHWTGAVGAAVAVTLVRPFAADPWAQGPLAVVATYWQLSPTATLGWVLGLALTGCLVAVVRRGPFDRAVPVWLLPLFAIGAAGAKSAQVPVIACGVGLAGLVWVVAARRRRGWRPTAMTYGGAVTGLLVVMAMAVLFLYPGAYGLRVDLGAWPASAAEVVYGTGGVSPRAVAAASLVALVRRWVPMLLPCAGLLVLLRRRPLEPAGWIGLGAVLGGLVAALVLTHPAASQYYFAVAALPIGLAFSGAGAGLFVQHVAAAEGLPGLHRVPRLPGLSRASGRAGEVAHGRALSIAGVVVVSTLALVAVWRVSRDTTAAAPVPPALGTPGALDVWQLLWAWASSTLLFVGMILLVVTLGWRAIGSRGVARPAGAWGGLLVLSVFGSGLWALTPALQIGVIPGPPVSAEPVPVGSGQPAISPALFAAGQYLREHADPHDIIATNRVWNGPAPGPDDHRDNRDFSVAALSGLRTDVSGYGYAPRMVRSPPAGGLPYFKAPFWDPERLAEELALVTDPTRARLAAAYHDRGVRWIVADERSGPVSTALAGLTDVVMHRDGVWLARLRPPGS